MWFNVKVSQLYVNTKQGRKQLPLSLKLLIFPVSLYRLIMRKILPIKRERINHKQPKISSLIPMKNHCITIYLKKKNEDEDIYINYICKVR